MRKLRRAGEPVSAIEGGGMLSGIESSNDGGVLALSETNAKVQMRPTLGNCKKYKFKFFLPEQLEDDMSNQVLLEKAAMASVLHKSAVNFELEFQCYGNIYQHPQNCHFI